MTTTEFTAAELEGLLGRQARARVGLTERRAFAGRRVLITGAAGSIGSALATELAACRPASLGLLDRSELGLFTIERELRHGWPRSTFDTFLSDVSHRASLARICRRFRPDVVYHAAAYKHVTMAERAVSAATLVNVVGTAEVAAAAAAVDARFVLISSDKASDPRSVMGATKRLAERVALSLASPRFRPIVVRFGNVIGSSGSVLPLMREAVRRGRPLQITDPDATRYFMTASEAVALVLRADLLGRSAETYWLDMGEPVRIGALASRLLELEARAGYAAVPVEIIGLRPGEKRRETLSDPHLVFERTVDRRIRAARERAVPARELDDVLRRLRRASGRADDGMALAILAAAVPGFTPSPEARATAQAGPIPAAPRRRLKLKQGGRAA
jgi:FlaA1/EpsC-like NDP-sugar epimerase